MRLLIAFSIFSVAAMCARPVKADFLVSLAPIIAGPGTSGSVFLGVSTDQTTLIGGELFNYNLTGVSFNSVDPDVIFTPIIGSGTSFAPTSPAAPTFLLVGTYNIAGSASPLDETTFELGFNATATLGGNSTYDSASDGPIPGSVSVVPEPNAMLLFGLGAVALARRRNTNRRV